MGSWSIRDARTLKDVAWAHVIPLKEILTPFPRHFLSASEWKEIGHGRSITVEVTQEPLIAWFEDLPVAILAKDGGKAHPRKVL